MTGEQTATIEDVATRFSLELPVHLNQKRTRSLAAMGGHLSDYTQQWAEYLMTDRRWTPDGVDFSFSDKIEQHYTPEQYRALMSQRQERRVAYGRISIELVPLVDGVQEGSITSSVDGVVQAIVITCPVHLSHDEQHGIAAAGNRLDYNSYRVQFSVGGEPQQRLMPDNLRGALPSVADLRVTKERYCALVGQREGMEDAYGRIIITFNPLVRQE